MRYLMQTTYYSADFAQAVGVEKSTLKNYINNLERTGYEIQRDHRNYRLFTAQNLTVFQALKKLHNEDGLTIKAAAQALTAADYHIDEVEIIPPAKQTLINKKESYELDRYANLSNAMELLAEHVKGIESQNANLLQLIQAQQQQNDLLIQQNEQLKNEFSAVKLQIEAPQQSTVETQKELDRLALQNRTIMATLNRLNVEKHEEEIQQYEEEKQQSKNIFQKLFRK